MVAFVRSERSLTKPMRVAFVNLPHPVPVVRRYMCSYNSPVFLFPPLELLSAATTVRDWGQHQVTVLDAIARRWDDATLARELRTFQPDVLLTLLGFEILEQDLASLVQLRKQFPSTRFAAFGHYATTFPREIMELTGIDFVLRGEPEVTCHELLGAIQGSSSLAPIQGLCFRGPEGIVVNPERPRLKPVDELPHPDYGLIEIDPYSEFLMPKPFVAIQTARGCPFACNFCVRSYGRQLGLRSPDNIVAELKELVRRFQIRSFRFTDDTFTAIAPRTLEICEKIRKETPGLVWSCLSRIDTIDDERASAMREAGCMRVYLGIESGSDRILMAYGKEYGVDRVPVAVRTLRRHGFEIGAFFMVGHPEETAEDFEKTARLVRTLDIDYATVGQVVPYPGTSLFDRYRDHVHFSLHPYQNEWKSPGRRKQLERWERRFLREMYCRPKALLRHVGRLIKHPIEVGRCAATVLPFALGRGHSLTPRNELV